MSSALRSPPTPPTSPSDLPRTAGVVVIGAGFAGLATAHALHMRGIDDVLVLEQEVVPGFHSSGRNAAIARRLIEEPLTLRLAVESIEAMAAMDSEVPILTRTGGLLTGSSDFLTGLAALAATAPELEARLMSQAEVEALVPALVGAELPGALFVPGDGVVDIHALLMAFMRPLRHGVRLSTPVTGLSLEADRITAVHTTRGTVATEQVVLAAGFASNQLARLAGLAPLPFRPVRRHLFTTAPTDLVAAKSPWVWDGSRGWYFRPEGAGLLMCACDETPWRDDQPMDTPIDPGVRDALAEKFDRCVPGLRDVRPARSWAGLRQLTPDHRFVIGPDPRLTNLTWVAGLGGHGMTTSCAVGRLGAAAVLGDAVPEGLLPARFLAGHPIGGAA